MAGDAPVIVTLETALKRLEKLRPRGLYDVMDELMSWHAPASAAQILSKLAPDNFRQRCSLGAVGDEGEFVRDVLSVIDKVTPLDIDYMDMFVEEANDLVLFPLPNGYPMSWDEWDEITGDVEGTTGESMALFLFFKSLDFRDAATFTTANVHFSWGVDTPALDDIEHLDWQKYCQQLEERGLGCFIKAHEIVDYSTGNVYFDFNPYDDQQDVTLPPFSVDGVRWLQKEWANAQPWSLAHKESLAKLRENPGLWAILLEIYTNCLVYVDHNKPRTLLELLGFDQEDGNVIVDDFYGPIGLEVAGEDGNDDLTDE